MSDYSERKKKKQKTINPHSYPTVVQRGGGGDGTYPRSFLYLFDFTFMGDGTAGGL